MEGPARRGTTNITQPRGVPLSSRSPTGSRPSLCYHPFRSGNRVGFPRPLFLPLFHGAGDPTTPPVRFFYGAGILHASFSPALLIPWGRERDKPPVQTSHHNWLGSRQPPTAWPFLRDSPGPMRRVYNGPGSFGTPAFPLLPSPTGRGFCESYPGLLMFGIRLVGLRSK